MSNPHAGDVAATFCATLVDQWVRMGMRHAVVSPGSRSTPLALAVTADGRVTVSVHHDERSAAFMALGIAMATKVPAMVVTTSGTAAVELHPAVVEAHHAGVPMLVCTADRPTWLHGIGAPQTINQTDLYGSSVRLFAEPGVPTADAAAQWRPLADSAMSAAMGPRPGPVHLNLAFDEPLVGTAGPLPAIGAAGDPDNDDDDDAGAVIDAGVLQMVARRVATGRGVIVAGGDIADPTGVMDLAAMVGWPVLADPRSGCRVPSAVTVAHPDALLRHDGFARASRPDVVLRLGTPWASKVLGAWLDGLDAHQIGVHTHGVRYDPGGSLDEVVTAEPGALCAAVAGLLGHQSAGAVRGDAHGDTGRGGDGAAGDAGDSCDAGGGGAGAPAGWLRLWATADQVAAQAIASQLGADAVINEPAVARTVAAMLPDGARLMVSSSMPVRDLEWFSAARTGLSVVSNRGANGIDGVVSTAVGLALAAPGPVAVLVGDVAMLHDTNALLGLVSRNVDLTVVVVDNDGGGIFSFLPQAGALPTDRFEEMFGTPHGVDLAALAIAHNLEATVVDDLGSLAGVIKSSAGHRGTTVVVVRTRRDANVVVHSRLHNGVIEAVSQGVELPGWP